MERRAHVRSFEDSAKPVDFVRRLQEPGEVARRHMQSTEFADDIRDFDVANIVDVESTILVPLTSSPLKRRGQRRRKGNEHDNRHRYFYVKKELAAVLVYSLGAGRDHRYRHQLHT
jgi:hypothetical protein